MEDNRGTDNNELPGCSGWEFVDAEAECSGGDDDFEEIFNQSGSEHLSLIDDSHAEQGESLQLLHELEVQTDSEQLSELKRKFLHSPLSKTVEETLSPRLAKVKLTSQKAKKVKKSLFSDSGIADETLESTVQGESSCLQVESTPLSAAPAATQETHEEVPERQTDTQWDVTTLLKCSNIQATLHAKFKEGLGVSYTELTRKFQSTRTMSDKWCCAVYGIREPHFETVKPLLHDHCDFVYLTHFACESGAFMLVLAEFKANKCKDTVGKLLRSLLGVQIEQMLLDPPKTRSPPVALFWYKKITKDPEHTWGQLPQWIANQVLIDHQLAGESQFKLSDMIQWALDNEITEECFIARGYAERANEDANAQAFLACNQQVKHVRDCAAMVNMYRRAELRNTTMSAWIHKNCLRVEDGPEDAWKNIVRFLRFNRVDFVDFLGVFKRFLNGEPKKSCIAFWGRPDSGKSTLAMSLIKFLKGKVCSFAISASQFWLSPLVDAKIALIDDVTDQCLVYLDTYLRGALDGNLVCIDTKHRNPSQLKMPPILLTTNIDIRSNAAYHYLHSRIQCFELSEPFPFNEDGTPVFDLSDQSWKSFFKRFCRHLELSDQEDDGEPQQTLRVSSRGTSHSI